MGRTFIREIIEEIRSRKRLSDKAHQWLSEGGLALLEKQIHADHDRALLDDLPGLRHPRRHGVWQPAAADDPLHRGTGGGQ
jgi:hypothetical protein